MRIPPFRHTAERQLSLSHRLGSLACLSLALCAFARADVITVVNRSDQPQALSDMVVFGTVAGQNGTQQEIINPPGNNPADKDVPFDAHGTQVFTTSKVFLKVTKIFFSQKRGNSEKESTNFATDQIVSMRIPLIEDPNGVVSVFLATDNAFANVPPPAEGLIFSVSAGVNPNFPGYFVGTQFDLNSGEVTNPFTGDVRVASTAFEITVGEVPEPSTLALTACGIVCAIAFGLYPGSRSSRRRRRLS